jgi:flagellar basal body P-ring formation protein FlgA
MRLRRLPIAGAAALAVWLAVTPQAAAQEAVVVATRVIYPGETVSAEALETITLRRGRVPPAAVSTDIGELDGKVARRTILPRRYIPLSSVREAYLVERGAPAQVELIEGALTITVTAVPLESGSAGDVIKLRNLDSGTIFTGIVLADGSIRVGAS